MAVLPCENLSPDPTDEHLASGFHDEILLKLQRISSLASIGRTSVRQYAADPPSARVISSELGVQFVGECSVRKRATGSGSSSSCWRGTRAGRSGPRTTTGT